jgi:L-2-hydroxyglutarate oxidase LhgO
MAARKVVVCSGATAKPLARSRAAKEMKTLTARGS